MARRASNRERMQRAALEAELTAKEKAEKKETVPTKKTTRKTATRTSTPAASGDRMKVVWKVIDDRSKEVAIFPFPQKAEAEEKAAKLTAKSKREHRVKDAKVPFDLEV